MTSASSVNSYASDYIDRALIGDFVDKRLIQEELSIEESIGVRSIRKVLQIAGVAISGLGKVPFIPISLKLKQLKEFRVVLAVGNALGFWALGSWSILNIIDEIYGPLTAEEKKLFTNRVNCLSKIAAVASGVVLSITSQAVIAYLAYVYNESKILMPIAIMASDTSFPFYSTFLSARKLFEKRSVSDTEKKLRQMKQIVIQLIESNRKRFIQMPRDEKKDYLNVLKRIKEKATKKDRLKALLPLILKANPSPQQSKVQKFGRVFFGMQGAHFTLTHLALLGIVSYVGGDLITSSAIGGAIAATLTILSTMYLEGTSMIKTSQRFFDGLYNFRTCKKNQTLSEQLSPKLTFSLKTLGLLISILAWGPSVEVAHDYIGRNAFRTYMQITSSLAVSLLISRAMLDIVDKIMEKKISITGSEEDKTILEADNKMKRFIRVIDKSPLIEFAKFTKTIPRNILDGIQLRCKITNSELEEYISRHNQQSDEKELLLV